ncbi:hypothetical protein ACRALDRAFT_1073241, partial [Sodiomyces alcalophilus JCM 7366]|uniref:uncharacterized protein n=1 Tax=Sodiomyces alcalophilus JCM 7366 TaxID=591952 RepID=UPI0039B4C9DE
IYATDGVPAAVEVRDIQPIRLCPHIRYSPTAVPSKPTEDLFTHNVNLAVRNEGRIPVYGSCRMCPMDYVVQMAPDKTNLIIFAYYGITPEEQSSELMSYVNLCGNRRRSDQRPGQIHAMYEASEHVFLPPEPRRWFPYGQLLRWYWDVFRWDMSQPK